MTCVVRDNIIHLAMTTMTTMMYYAYEIFISIVILVLLAVLSFYIVKSYCCVPREEERNADAVPQLAVAVQPARTLLAAEQAGRSASAAAERAGRLASAAAAAAVNTELGYFPYFAAVKGGGGSASEQKQPECAICLEAFVQGATCSEVPSCRHLFHRDCIARWMRSNKTTCPLCRVPIRIVPGSEPLSAAEHMV